MIRETFRIRSSISRTGEPLCVVNPWPLFWWAKNRIAKTGAQISIFGDHLTARNKVFCKSSYVCVRVVSQVFFLYPVV